MSRSETIAEDEAGKRSQVHCSHGALIERYRLDQGEHAIAGAKRELVDGLARRQCEKMAMPIEVDGDAGERTVIVGLDTGDGAGKRGAADRRSCRQNAGRYEPDLAPIRPARRYACLA